MNAVDPKADSKVGISVDQDIKSIIEEEQVDKDRTEFALHCNAATLHFEKFGIKIHKGGAEKNVALVVCLFVAKATRVNFGSRSSNSQIC